ncbi:hypothetical protein GA0074694_1403 [Micromonospora inyonensis]|uniref:Uncharacterized protein n=1 Tax=Micromonospora inyonensis TaxID=47866 RepID=A0A1C6RFC3_9ACTN|nr:hypothetical protein GA0074694_1403 [Micromonospora inyonensis]
MGAYRRAPGGFDVKVHATPDVADGPDGTGVRDPGHRRLT